MHPLALIPLLTTLATALPFAVSPRISSPPYNPSSPYQGLPECRPGDRGTTPGVYYCLNPDFGGPCEWWAYDSTKDVCLTFDENVEKRVRSILPQGGGYCEFFKEKNCGGGAVQIWKGDPTTTLECPGMSDAGKPDWFASMKCRTFARE